MWYSVLLLRKQEFEAFCYNFHWNDLMDDEGQEGLFKQRAGVNSTITTGSSDGQWE